MVDFDTTVRLHEVETWTTESALDAEAFIEEVADKALTHAKNIGNGGRGQLWMDYSSTFASRYIVCGIKEITQPEPTEAATPEESREPEATHTYKIRLSYGQKPGRIGEISIMAACLVIFWRMGPIFRGVTTAFDFIAMGIAAIILVILLIHTLTGFGPAQAKSLRQIIG